MPVINHTKNVIIAGQAEVARTWLARLMGLMFRKGLPEGGCMIISPCSSIHTCFMKFPIDVIFVSPEGKVLELVENMPPFRFSRWVRGASVVVELPCGTLCATGTTLNDRVSLGEDMPER